MDLNRLPKMSEAELNKLLHRLEKRRWELHERANTLSNDAWTAKRLFWPDLPGAARTEWRKYMKLADEVQAVQAELFRRWAPPSQPAGAGKRSG
jgi:hypothetical protein